MVAEGPVTGHDGDDTRCRGAGRRVVGLRRRQGRRQGQAGGRRSATSERSSSRTSCRRRCRSTASSWPRSTPRRRSRSVPGCRPSSRRSTSPRGRSSRRTSLLFTLDKREYQAKLQQARAELEVSMARLGKAETDERRLKPLAERRAVPQQDYDNAAANLLSAQAAVSASKVGPRRSGTEPELLHDQVADQGPDRQTSGRARQPRRQGRGDAAGYRVQHRSDPRQCHDQRSGIPEVLRSATEKGSGDVQWLGTGADPGRWQRVPAQGQDGHRGPCGGPEDRHAQHHRGISEPGRPAAPGTVRPHARGRGYGRERHPGAEAGGAGDPGHEERAGGRCRQHGRAAHDPARRDGGRHADRARRREAR